MDIEIRIPDLGTDVLEVVEILVKIGDFVKKDDSLITVEGQKTSLEVPSTHSGMIKSILVTIGQQVKTGSSIVILEKSERDNELKIDNSFHLKSLDSGLKVSNCNEMFLNKNSNNLTSLVHATPTIRRLARQLNINLGKVKGSGRKGRIVQEDIISYANKILKRESDNVISENKTKDCVNFSNKFGKLSELYLTKVQQTSGKHLSKSWSIIPHVTQFGSSDITELEKFRQKYNSKLHSENLNSKLTILIFAMKVVAQSLKIFPKFNSILCPDTNSRLILNQSINIGIAIDTENGLLVPVINDVDKKNLSTLSTELSLLSKKAKLGKLTLANTVGGGFTISNLGGIGGAQFTPIINCPEVAILGMSKALIQPFWDGKEFKPRLILPLSLSYDHRVVDGVEAVRFINFISTVLSDIRLLII